MERIEACCDFHPFTFIDRVPVSKDHAAFIKRGASVGEVVFDYKIFGYFCIYERCRENTVRCLHALEVIDSQSGKPFEDLI